jgi:hypothetical protein
MVLRIVLGAVYTAMAIGQLASFPSMPGILSAYGPVTGANALRCGARRRRGSGPQDCCPPSGLCPGHTKRDEPGRDVR